MDSLDDDPLENLGLDSLGRICFYWFPAMFPEKVNAVILESDGLTYRPNLRLILLKESIEFEPSED